MKGRRGRRGLQCGCPVRDCLGRSDLGDRGGLLRTELGRGRGGRAGGLRGAVRGPSLCRHASTLEVGFGDRIMGARDVHGGGWLRTIGVRALYRATLCDDLPEYVLLVGIPFYLDLRGKGEIISEVSMAVHIGVD